MTLGEYIKEYRTTHDLSTRAFARAAGLSPGYLSQLESGAHPRTGEPITPTIRTYKGVAQATGVTLDELCRRVDGRIHIEADAARRPDATVKGAYPIDPSAYHAIPILGRIAAGLPMLAEEYVEGYTLTDLNGGSDYFALRVRGDSMSALGLNDGYLIIVRQQSTVENGDVAVVMVGDEDATVKRYYSTGSTVTLMPQSLNPEHRPQIYDTRRTPVRVLGRVVKAEFSL